MRVKHDLDHRALGPGQRGQQLGLEFIGSFNPLAGIFSLYRAAYFPEELDGYPVLIAALMSLIILAVGILVFTRTERAVLKEI